MFEENQQLPSPGMEALSLRPRLLLNKPIEDKLTGSKPMPGEMLEGMADAVVLELVAGNADGIACSPAGSGQGRCDNKGDGTEETLSMSSDVTDMIALIPLFFAGLPLLPGIAELPFLFLVTGWSSILLLAKFSGFFLL